MRTQQPGELTFPVIRETAEDIILVSDAQVIETLNFLLTRMKILVEPTGAVAPAAKVGVIISGGNMDAGLLAKLLS